MTAPKLCQGQHGKFITLGFDQPIKRQPLTLQPRPRRAFIKLLQHFQNRCAALGIASDGTSGEAGWGFVFSRKLRRKSVVATKNDREASIVDKILADIANQIAIRPLYDNFRIGARCGGRRATLS
jgi:hypothetical protein